MNILFFFTALSILVLGHIYIGMRIIVPMRISSRWKTVLWSFLMALMPLAPVYLVLRSYGLGRPWIQGLAWITYLSLGFFGFVIVCLLIRDGAILILTLFRFFHKSTETVPNTDKPVAPARRNFLIHSTNLGILGISGTLCGCGFTNTRNRPRMVSVAVPICDLPDDLEGFRIVQISDIHISPTVKKGYVRHVVGQVSHLKPDIVVFTGDLADGPVSMFRNEASPFKDMCAAFRSYFVTGNHEYYAGVEAWLEEVDRLGFQVLLNEHRMIKQGSGRILLAGVTDYNGGRFLTGHRSDPAKAVAGAARSDVKILLAHQPRNIFAASKAGFDLQISGHTHGGQFFPWQLLVCLQQPFLAGLYRYKRTQIYVSRGTGYWGPPFRLGAPSEITLIRLTKQGSRGVQDSVQCSF